MRTTERKLSCWVSKALFLGHLGETGCSLSRRVRQLVVQNVMVKSHWTPPFLPDTNGHLAYSSESCEHTGVPTRPGGQGHRVMVKVTVTLACDTNCLFLMEQRQERTDHCGENSGLNGPFLCLLLSGLFCRETEQETKKRFITMSPFSAAVFLLSLV